MSGEGGVEGIRSRIEAVDQAILDAVAERIELARRIGTLKRDNTAATLDTHREAAVIRRAVESGRRRGLPEEAVRDLFWILVGLCRDVQLDDR
jgi:chorismate mutase